MPRRKRLENILATARAPQARVYAFPTRARREISNETDYPIGSCRSYRCRLRQSAQGGPEILRQLLGARVLMQSRLVALDPERSLHYAEGGLGRATVLLHGALATHADWPRELVQRLGRSGSVMAVDRPGHGASVRPRFAGAPRAQAKQIREALKLEQPITLIAHSFGAMVALAWAEQYRADIHRMILLAPICFPEYRLIEHTYLAPRGAPAFGPFWSAAAAASLDPLFLEAVSKLMFAPHPVPAGWLGRQREAGAFTQQALVAEGEDALAIAPASPHGYLRPNLSSVPTTIIVGGRDLIIRHAQQGLALAQLIGAPVIRVPHAGHMLHHSAPDALFEALDG